MNQETSKLGFNSISQKDTVSEKAVDTSGKDAYLRTKEQQAKQRKLENDIRKTEEKIEELEAQIAKIDEQICLPENATNAAKLSELSSKRQELEQMLETVYETWEAFMSN